MPIRLFSFLFALSFAFGIEPKAARMADGRLWTTRNLDVQADESWCAANNEENCRRYGRLYTWPSAARGCRALGTGWRLPSEEEWRQLARHYGGVSDDSKDRGTAAYQSLLSGGSSGFNAVLGGNRAEDGKFERLEEHGFYWTASESALHTAWFYNFGRGSLGLYRQIGGNRLMGLSVRCVKD